MAKIEKVKLPVLNIGLGGTGFDGIMKLKSEFHKRFEPEVKPDGTVMDQPEDMLYCVMDTDGGALDVPKHGVKLESHEKIRLCPEGMSFANLKETLKDLPFIKEWFDDTINPAMVGDGVGAGCYRQVSRLFFAFKFVEIRNALQAKLTQLATVKPGAAAIVPKVIQVNLIAGISGGTGGGTLMDTAYLIRKLAEGLGCKINFKAYLILPDISVANIPATNPNAQDLCKLNGYAVLKELDYWMESERNGARMKQQYTQSPTDVIEWRGQPFDFVFKLGRYNEAGSPIDQPYDHAMSAISDYLVNCYSSTDANGDEKFNAIQVDKAGIAAKVAKTAATGGAYSFQSNDSNKNAMEGTHRKPKPVFHLNESLGAYSNESQERVALVQQMTLIYNAVVERMDTHVDQLTKNLFVNPADLHEFNDYLLTVEKAAAKGGGTVRQGYDQRNPFHGTGDSKIFDGTSVAVYNKATLRDAALRANVHGENYSRFVQNTDEKEVPEKNNLLDALWTLFVNKAGEIGRDLAKGPEYLYLMLNVGDDCFLKQLTTATVNVHNRYLSMQNTVQSLKNDADALFKKFKDVPGYQKLIGLDETPFRNYLNGCRELYNATRAYYYLRALKPAMEAFKEKVMSYTGILEGLVKEIRKQQRSYAEELSTTHVDSPLFNIDNMKRSMAALCADDKSKANFTSGIFNKTMDYCEQWTGQNVDMATLPDELDKALESLRTLTFAPLLNLGFEAKIKQYQNLQTDAQLANYVANVMAPNLRGGASPMFAYEGGRVGSDPEPSSMSVVSIPQGAANIRQGIEDYCMTNNVSVTIKEVPGLDRIFWVTNQYMMPMHRYKQLQHFKDRYNAVQHKGYHLYMKDALGDELTVGMTDVFKRKAWKELIPDLFVERIPNAGVTPAVKAAIDGGLLRYDYTWPDFVNNPGVDLPKLEVYYCKLYLGEGVNIEPVRYAERIQASRSNLAGAQGWDAFVRGIKALEPSDENKQALLDGLNKLQQHLAEVEALRAARTTQKLDLDHLDEKMQDWGNVLNKSGLLEAFNPGEGTDQVNAKKAAYTECYERAACEYIMRNKIMLDEFAKQGKCIQIMDEAFAQINEEIKAVEKIIGSIGRPDRKVILERSAKLADLMIYDETAELQTASFKVLDSNIFNVMKGFSPAALNEFANCDQLAFPLQVVLDFGMVGVNNVMVKLALKKLEAVKEDIFDDKYAAKRRVAAENARKYQERFEAAKAGLMDLLKGHTINMDDMEYYEKLADKMIDAFDYFAKIVKKIDG